MAQTIGQRSTYQSIDETRLIRVVDDEIGLIEPNEAPLITLLMKMKKRKRTTSPRVEWFERDYVARWAQNSANQVNANAASTTVTVTDASLFVKGDMFVIPRLVTSSGALEMCRVTNVDYDTNELTVVRNVGGAGLDTIAANASLRIIGDAHEEGEAMGKAKTTPSGVKLTYTQIFRTPIEFTKTQIASRTYGAPNGDRAAEHKIKLKEHKIKMNAALLFGRASESLTGGATGKPIRTTAGIISVISTNVVDGGGVLTRKLFEAFARQAFRYGKSTKVLLASPLIISAINQWATQFLMVKPTEERFGVSIQQVETGHGIWLLVRDWMLENGIAGQNGFAGQALSVDGDEVSYRWLEENGINRDTKLTENAVQNGADGVVDEILTEGGFQIKQEKYHARLYNVQDYQA